MSLRFLKQIPALATLAVGLALIGSPAQAALTLTISNAGSASNQSLVITNGSSTGAGTGNYDFTGVVGPVHYNFIIDGQNITATPLANGHAVGSFNTTNINSVSFSDNAFGEFTINNLTATRSQSSSDSFVNDTTTDVAEREFAVEEPHDLHGDLLHHPQHADRRPAERDQAADHRQQRERRVDLGARRFALGRRDRESVQPLGLQLRARDPGHEPVQRDEPVHPHQPRRERPRLRQVVTIDSRTDVFSAPSRPPSPWP